MVYVLHVCCDGTRPIRLFLEDWGLLGGGMRGDMKRKLFTGQHARALRFATWWKDWNLGTAFDKT